MIYYKLIKNGKIIDEIPDFLDSINQILFSKYKLKFEIQGKNLIWCGTNNIISNDIFDEVNSLFYELGQYYIVYTPFDDINNLLSNLTVLNEEIAYSNMTDSEKKEKICGYIKNLCLNECDRKTLYITDKYLFPNNPDDGYKEWLLSIFIELHYDSIVVILNTKNYNQKLEEEIKRHLQDNDITLVIKNHNQIHDRFWISNLKKGIVIGTSLNGLSKQLCYINELKDEDTKIIVDYLKKHNLI